MDAILNTVRYLLNINSLLILFITTILAAYYYIENSRGVYFIKKLPGPSQLPILGSTFLTLQLSPNKALQKLISYFREHGTIVSGHLFGRTAVFLSDPQDIEIILGSSEHINKSLEYRYFAPWLGDGLLINTGDKWRRHRKIIAPTFHINILKTFVPLFYENSIDLVRRLRDEVGKEFDCHDYLSAVTVDILTETAMGVKREKRENTGYEYALAVMKMSDIVHRRTYDVSLRPDMIFKYTNFAKKQKKLLNIIHTLTNKVIKEKTKAVEEQQQKTKQNSKTIEMNTAEKMSNSSNNSYVNLHYVRDDLDAIDENDVGEKKRTAFLETMIELKKNSGKMTDEEIWEEVNTIMFEGHDTTAAGSSFALCVLGCHQDIQDRLHEELDAIFGNSDRPCTFQDTVEMKYLERVILETLRLFPPVPLIARCLKEDVTIGNYTIPKDATVIITQYATHRLEKYYPNPEVFDPDNFLPEKMQQRHYYSFIPFSGGPRSCVGRKYAMLKLKVLLSTILRNYRIISNIADKDFPLKGDIILKRIDGFNIKIEPRKSMFCDT